jgi:hypothetical protein
MPQGDGDFVLAFVRAFIVRSDTAGGGGNFNYVGLQWRRIEAVIIRRVEGRIQHRSN